MARIIELKKRGNYYSFRLSNKPEFLCKIDSEDVGVLEIATWYIHSHRKGKNPRSYIRSTWSVSEGHKHLHREVLRAGKFTPERTCDHIDFTKTLDNRKRNLRIVNSIESMANRSNSGERYKGFTICNFTDNGRKRFQAYKEKTYIYSSYSIKKLKAKLDNS